MSVAQIDAAVRSVIEKRLSEIEVSAGVRILYAVESGSRAWGFPSRDSDYDVRFIYIHPTEWYLTINPEGRRDVIEQPIEGDYDLSGWDIRKTLVLFAKSNPPLLEWLDSSIGYVDCCGFAERLRELRKTYFSPQACAYHYLHMAQGNYRTYLRGPNVWLKKYFYVLRPLLAVRWIEQNRGVVPMLFPTLLETIEDQAELLRDIQDLLDRKMAGDELDQGPAVPSIQSFIDTELTRMDALKIAGSRLKIDREELNRVFREMLAR